MNTQNPSVAVASVIGAACLALGLVASAWQVSKAIVSTRADKTIDVTGSAKKAIVSDQVVWRGRLYADDFNLKTAYAAIKRDTASFAKAAKDAGLEGVVYSALSSETYTVEETTASGNKISKTAYRVVQSFELVNTNVQATTQASGKVAENLLQQGIQLESGLQYLYTKLPELRLEMLKAATQDAKERAQTIASGTGGRIGAAQNARMGVFQITARNSTQIDDYGSYDTSSIEKDITAVVSVGFQLER